MNPGPSQAGNTDPPPRHCPTYLRDRVNHPNATYTAPTLAPMDPTAPSRLPSPTLRTHHGPGHPTHTDTGQLPLPAALADWPHHRTLHRHPCHGTTLPHCLPASAPTHLFPQTGPWDQFLLPSIPGFYVPGNKPSTVSLPSYPRPPRTDREVC